QVCDFVDEVVASLEQGTALAIALLGEGRVRTFFRRKHLGRAVGAMDEGRTVRLVYHVVIGISVVRWRNKAAVQLCLATFEVLDGFLLIIFAFVLRPGRVRHSEKSREDERQQGELEQRQCRNKLLTDLHHLNFGTEKSASILMLSFL